jgi:hypothetical protein
MALHVDREQIDDICPRLFRALDSLGLLPRQLGWKRDASGRPHRIAPTEYEKYPRLLFGSIARYNDVQAGFQEWESRVLRTEEAQRHKEEHYPDINDLRRRLIEHNNVFTNKVNLQHLRTSLYARVFQYLFPRRVLANTYCDTHRGAADVVGRFNQLVSASQPEDRASARSQLQEFLNATLPATIMDSVQKVEDAYSDQWDTIVADAKAALVDNSAYYLKILRGEEPATPPKELEQADGGDTEEVRP